MQPTFAEPTGAELRDAAFELLDAHRSHWIDRAKHVIAALALTRDDFTTDDVRPLLPLPAGINPVLVGLAFKVMADFGLIERVDYRKSRRPEAHCRTVAVWRAASRHALLIWKSANPIRPLPAEADDERHGGQGR